MKRFGIAAMALLLHFILSAQIDPHKLDSLKRSIDASAKAIRQYQDSFKKKQDCLYVQQIKTRKKKSEAGSIETPAVTETVSKGERKDRYYVLIIGLAGLLGIAALVIIKIQDPKSKA
jgi:hypothetical protein